MWQDCPSKGRNTSNLYWHLKEHHPTSYAEISPSSRKRESNTHTTQQTTESSIAKTTKYSQDSPRYKDITRAIAYHIGKDGVPLSTVERAGFKHMIHKLNPKYDLPSRKYFSRHAIPTLYSEVHDVFVEQVFLQNVYLVLVVMLLIITEVVFIQKMLTT